MPAAYQLHLALPDRRRRPPAPIERRVHCAVVDLLRVAARPGWLFLHPANGEYRTAQTAALLQRLGVLPGAFDLLLIGPDGIHRWLELKRAGGGRLSPAQQWFAAELERRGVPHAVASGFDQAVEVLQSWGVLRAIRVQ